MTDQTKTTARTWDDLELEGALNECRRTCGPTVPCEYPEYRAARYRYHTLLVARGLLDPKLADRLEAP